MSPVGVDGKIGVEGEIYLSDNYWNKLDDMMRKAAGEREALGWHQIKPFKLDKARTDERISDLPEDGDVVLLLSLDGSAQIKLNSPNSGAFDLEVYERINHHFEDLYLTNTAQSGKTLRLLIGKGDWGLTKTIPEIDLSGTVRNDYLEQITDPLKIAQIIEDGHIKPHADIACEKILISGTKRLDQWRSTEDYTYIAPGMILLKSTTKLSDWQHPSNMTYIHGGQIYTQSITTDSLAAACVTAEKIAAINADISTITAGDGVIIIDENGILAVKNSTTMFQLSADTGAAYFKGNVEAGALVLPVGTDKWAT